MIDIKRIISVLLACVLICLAFAGCSSDKEGDATASTSAVTTEGAKIKEADAINLIKDSYTAEELGLADMKDDYSFMVASTGVEYNGDYYVKVVANVVTQNEDITSKDGGKTFSMKTVGEYLISFDGDKVLMKDMNTNEYKKLENRVPDYSAKGNSTTEK